MPGGFDPIFDDIIQGVTKHGSFEIDWLILLNTVFRREPSKPSPEAQLNAWAKENNLRHETIEIAGRGKKRTMLIRFSRQR